ncbi:hypothetical protein [Roseovarius sp. MMSF_3305]|uniref:hypothetical protein n=1 Tax=Roseovarius sp. MMSF_3305 TaxID=3046697 RepID=UPI00273DA8F7|nr:hypothetical protein [Roseovarius sp. MMSF_3305]
MEQTFAGSDKMFGHAICRDFSVHVQITAFFEPDVSGSGIIKEQLMLAKKGQVIVDILNRLFPILHKSCV